MALTIAEPLPYTILSLPRYARILGINPVHFQRGQGDDVWPLMRNSCTDLWPRYSWQDADRVSHYDLALAISQAEREIAQELGWYPAPTWVAQEVAQFPRHHRPDLWRYYGRGVRGEAINVQTMFAKVIAPGQRAVTAVGTARTSDGSLAYSDEDGDGFFETATVTIATTVTDPYELKVYHDETLGDERWEIRPPRRKSVSGGVLTAVFDSWLFIDPDLQAAYPTPAGFGAIDVSTVANYVTEVDVYREYNDATATSATFMWEPTPRGALIDGFCSVCGGAGCVACTLTEQDGCLHVRDPNLGFVVPQPATYSAADGWTGVCFSECRDPDMVKMWYYAGDIGRRSLRGVVGFNEELSDYWAQAIAWLATCRLERPFCSCANVMAIQERWRDDLAAMSSRQQQAQSYQVDPSIVLQNPFGTMLGEVMAWQRVRRERGRVPRGGVV